MGKVSGNWITGTHSGRACKHDDIYTKVNKKTGACYSVKLCNPNRNANETQQKTRDAFTLVSQATSQWINEQKEANSADYKKIKKVFDRQQKYSTLRGMMIAKGMYSVSSDKKTVTVDLDERTDFRTAFGITSASGSNSNSDSSNQQNQQSAKKTVTLTVSPEGSGSVTGDGQYDAGATAHLVATANSGYQFVRWDDGDTSPNRTITVTEDKTFNAIFTTQASGDDLDQG